MASSGKRHTEWKFYKEGKRRFRIRAEYGFQHFQGQAPYWSVTGTIERAIPGGRWFDEAGGCLHDEIAKHFPKLVPTIRWHLSLVPGGPMHYVSNALFWWEHYTGVRKFQDYELRERSATDLGRERFQRSIVFGALPDDVMPDGKSLAEIQAWLESRLPRLMETFKADIDAYDPALWPVT